jgi:hypothetical protein
MHEIDPLIKYHLLPLFVFEAFQVQPDIIAEPAAGLCVGSLLHL